MLSMKLLAIFTIDNKIMTYKELKEKLNELTEDQLNQEISVMQDDVALKDLTSIEVSEEDYIYENNTKIHSSLLRGLYIQHYGFLYSR